MATYTPVDLEGTGSVSTQTFTSGSPVEIIFQNLPARAIGSAYFTISAPPHVASLPSYFSGSQITSSVSASSTVDTVADVVIDVAGNHWAGCVVNFNNLDVSQSLAWTSSVDIPAGDAVLQGTAGISCIIT